MRVFWFNLVAIVCILGGIFLAVKGIQGWGWLIFGGLCVTSVPNGKTKK
jgi:hypothetical protein